MSFKVLNNEEYRKVSSHKDVKGCPRSEKRGLYSGNHPKDWQTFMRFCVANTSELGKQTHLDTLNTLSVSNDNKFNTLTFQNDAGDSFNICVQYFDITYDVTIASYRHFAGFSTKEVETKDYKYSDSATNQMGFNVHDIFKYYYHLNKDTDNHGFDVSLDKKEVDAMWTLIKRCAEMEDVDNTSPQILGLGDNIMVTSEHVRQTEILLWNVKNRKIKWDDTNFFKSCVLMNLRHLMHPSSAQNLASLYVTGSNLKFNDPSLIIFDEPKSLVDVINDHEDTRHTDIRFVLNQINKKLKPNEEELLKSTYQPIVLKKGFFTTMDECNGFFENNAFATMDSANYPTSRILATTDKEYSRMMSYPLFAFRNIYVQDWIPTGEIMLKSMKILIPIIKLKVEEQKSEKMKLLKERKGGYIDSISDNKYMYIKNSEKSDYCFSANWDKAFRKRQNRKRRDVVKKSATSDV